MSTEQQTSKYLPIWKQLKATGSCRVTAPPQYHKKIIKAVRKRRDKDLAFLYLLRDEHKQHSITATVSPETPTIIEFKLKIELTLQGL
jgi:hypothetical protein